MPRPNNDKLVVDGSGMPDPYIQTRNLKYDYWTHRKKWIGEG